MHPLTFIPTPKPFLPDHQVPGPASTRPPPSRLQRRPRAQTGTSTPTASELCGQRNVVVDGGERFERSHFLSPISSRSFKLSAIFFAFLSSPCRPVGTSSAGEDMQQALWLWRWSAEQVQLPPERDLPEAPLPAAAAAAAANGSSLPARARNKHCIQKPASPPPPPPFLSDA